MEAWGYQNHTPEEYHCRPLPAPISNRRIVLNGTQQKEGARDDYIPPRKLRSSREDLRLSLNQPIRSDHQQHEDAPAEESALRSTLEGTGRGSRLGRRLLSSTNMSCTWVSSFADVSTNIAPISSA